MSAQGRIEARKRAVAAASNELAGHFHRISRAFLLTPAEQTLMLADRLSLAGVSQELVGPIFKDAAERIQAERAREQ